MKRISTTNMDDTDPFDFSYFAVVDIRSSENQAQAAKVYAKAIRMMGHHAAFGLINDAVRERWGVTGLLRVKELAWKELKRDA